MHRRRGSDRGVFMCGRGGDRVESLVKLEAIIMAQHSTTKQDASLAVGGYLQRYLGCWPFLLLA